MNPFYINHSIINYYYYDTSYNRHGIEFNSMAYIIFVGYIDILSLLINRIIIG